MITAQIELVTKLLEESVDGFGPQWPLFNLSVCLLGTIAWLVGFVARGLRQSEQDKRHHYP